MGHGVHVLTVLKCNPHSYHTKPAVTTTEPMLLKLDIHTCIRAINLRAFSIATTFVICG